MFEILKIKWRINNDSKSLLLFARNNNIPCLPYLFSDHQEGRGAYLRGHLFTIINSFIRFL